MSEEKFEMKRVVNGIKGLLFVCIEYRSLTRSRLDRSIIFQLI